MARKERTMVTIVDDLSGEEQKEGTGQTVSFVWQGKAYEIDLSDYNAAKFLGVMAPYVEKARRVRNSPAATPSAPRVGGDGRRRGGGRAMGRSKEELDTIRAWARANGHTVADSGIISKAVLKAYEARETAPAASADTEVPTTPPDRPRPSPTPRHQAEAETSTPSGASGAGGGSSADTKVPEKVTDEKSEPAKEPVPTTPAAVPPAFSSPTPEPQHTSPARRVFGRGSENR